jgi:hypothetical protein
VPTGSGKEEKVLLVHPPFSRNSGLGKASWRFCCLIKETAKSERERLDANLKTLPRTASRFICRCCTTRGKKIAAGTDIVEEFRSIQKVRRRF